MMYINFLSPRIAHKKSLRIFHLILIGLSNHLLDNAELTNGIIPVIAAILLDPFNFQGFLICAISVVKTFKIFWIQENKLSQVQLLDLLMCEMLHMHIFKRLRFLQLLADIA